MKIRTGFVSNSSSSSFMVMTTKENHEKAMKNLHPFIQAVMSAVEPKEETKLFGKEIIAFGYNSDMGGCTNLDDIDIAYDGERPAGDDEDSDGNPIMSYYEAFDAYCDEIEKNKEESFKFNTW